MRDVEADPQSVLALNDVKNATEVDGYTLPSSVYPFQEDEFIDYFKRAPDELDFLPSSCREFPLSKGSGGISY